MITFKELQEAFTLDKALQIIWGKKINLFSTRKDLHFIASFIYLKLALKSFLVWFDFSFAYVFNFKKYILQIEFKANAKFKSMKNTKVHLKVPVSFPSVFEIEASRCRSSRVISKDNKIENTNSIIFWTTMSF